MMKMMPLALFIAVMTLSALLVPYQLSGKHSPCYPTAKKSRLKVKIKQNIAVENLLNVIISLSMSVYHAIEYFTNHLSMMNQSFCAGKKIIVSEKMSPM